MNAKKAFDQSGEQVNVKRISFDELSNVINIYFLEKLGVVPGTLNYYDADGLLFFDFSTLEEVEDEKLFDEIYSNMKDLGLNSEEWIYSFRQIMANILGGNAEDYPLYIKDIDQEPSIKYVEFKLIDDYSRHGEISVKWTIEDIMKLRSDISENQAHEVLKYAKRNYYTDEGINFEILAEFAERLFPELDEFLYQGVVEVACGENQVARIKPSVLYEIIKKEWGSSEETLSFCESYNSSQTEKWVETYSSIEGFDVLKNPESKTCIFCSRPSFVARWNTTTRNADGAEDYIMLQKYRNSQGRECFYICPKCGKFCNADTDIL